MVALVLALILIGLSLPVFNNISGKHFILSDLVHIKFIASILVVGIVTGIIAGLYPALYLASFKPATVLKGGSVSEKGNGRLRQILVIIQFTLSILIAITAVFMYMQLKHLQDVGSGI